MHTPKAILLDLGGVVFQSAGKASEQINWSVILELNHKYGHDLNIGRDLFPDFMREYNQLTAQNLAGAEFLAAVFDTLDFNAELVKFLGEIAPIIIVSDNYRENITYISQRYDFGNWAKRQIYSFDYQLEKANPLFFEKLLADIDLDASELLFIDDSAHKLDSAAGHGIQGIQFVNNAQVIDAVKQTLGISS